MVSYYIMKIMHQCIILLTQIISTDMDKSGNKMVFSRQSQPATYESALSTNGYIKLHVMYDKK